MAESENPWRQWLRIEGDPLKRRCKSVLQSAYDNDAACDKVEFIGVIALFLTAVRSAMIFSFGWARHSPAQGGHLSFRPDPYVRRITQGWRGPLNRTHLNV